jgi:amidase
MGRTVTDTAVLLTAMAGVDENDPETQNAAELDGVDFTQFASVDAAQGQRIGIVIQTEDSINVLLDQAGIPEADREAYVPAFLAQNDMTRAVGQAFAEAGMEVIEVLADDMPSTPDANEALPPGFKRGINAFLAGLGDAAPVASLEEIIAFNLEDAENRMPYAQDHLEEAQATDLTDEEFAAMRDEHISAAQDGFRALFETYDVRIILDNQSQAYAPAGYPAITIPIGLDSNGQPQSIHIVGDYLSEPALITAGYVLEQAVGARAEPDLQATMQLIQNINGQ